MKNFCYTLLALFLFAPAMAVAQDLVLVESGGLQYEGIVSAFTPSFPEGEPSGPFTLVKADPFEACTEFTNASEIAGNYAFVTRGTCPFVDKVANAKAAGAIGVIVGNNSDTAPDPIVMGGTHVPGVHDIPAVMVSTDARDAIDANLAFDDPEITIIPVEIAPVPTAGLLDTGVIETALFDNGYIGGSSGFLSPPGFTFNGEQGLYHASLILAQASGDTSIVVFNNAYQAAPEYVTVEGVEAVAAPFPTPFQDFGQGYTTVFETGAPPQQSGSTDLGIRVTANAYARAGDPFVILDYWLENTTAATLEGVYAGIYADLDAGSAFNLFGADDDQGVIYVYDPADEEASYFGVAVLNQDVSGYASTPNVSSTYAVLDGSVFAGLQNGGDVTVPGDTAQDLRPFIGAGPFDIGTEPVNVQFALLAGADAAAISANAEAARNFSVSTEATTPQGTYVLDAAYPNPFASRTRIGFELPVSEHVTLKVYDVLGREVATLMDGVAPAGKQFATFDAASLPSGVYFYRLQAGSTQLIQRVTVVR